MRNDARKYLWALPSLITSAILLIVEGVIRLCNRLTFGDCCNASPTAPMTRVQIERYRDQCTGHGQ